MDIGQQPSPLTPLPSDGRGRPRPEREQPKIAVWIIGLALGLITLAVFWPCRSHQFLDYDDQQYVTENGHVQAGFSSRTIAWAFTTFYASNWHPLTWLSHMLDCQIYDLHAAGHHLTNVLLHVANSILLFLLLNRMTGLLWRSACVAALFAWHPLHVESVAWIAERKDVLSAFFFLLTLWTYARYVTSVECRVSRRAAIIHHPFPLYALTLLLFALGLMSKPMLVTLPFLLLLLDYWPLQRLQLKTKNLELKTSAPSSILHLLLEKLPFLALSAVCCVFTVMAQHKSFSIVSTAGLPLSTRIAHVLISYGHYLWKTFWPRHLAVYYPYEKNIAIGFVALAGILLGLITLLAIGLAKRLPYLFVGWFWYLGMLVPVIGLVQVGDQAWADRYTYLPLIGLFIVIIWAGSDIASAHGTELNRRDAKSTESEISAPFASLRFKVLIPIAALVGLALIIQTSRQLRYWQNTRTLFTHAAQVTRKNAKAVTILGSLLANEGKMDQAMALYSEALRYQPDDPETHFSRANALEKQGKLDDAIAEYRKALWFRPIAEETHVFLGVALAKQKKYDEAAAEYHAALSLNPDSALAHNDLGKLLHTQGRLDEAITQYSAALRSNPNLAPAHNNLGVILLQKGQVAAAVAQLKEAVRLRPGDVESEYNLALALNQQQKWIEAAQIFSRIATGRPDDARLHSQFALALAHSGNTREAMSHYAHALLQQPDFVEALDGLAWILATAPRPEFRNGKEAVPMAERACALTGQKDPEKLKTLAAAYAEAGQFAEATATAQQTRKLAVEMKRKELMDQCGQMLESFGMEKPWRERD